MSSHLTHGWEPGLDPADSLLRRYLAATTDVSAHTAGCAGGRVQRWDDLYAADPASAVLFDNLAVLMQPPVRTDMRDVLDRLAAFYPPDRHFCLLSAWPTPDLGNRLELMGHPPFMLRPAGGQAPPAPPGLTITRVRSPEDLETFVATLVDAYPMPQARGTPLTDPAVLDGPLRLFVGWLDGEAVGTSGARLGHGIVDVEYVAASPRVRGRGVGAAMTWAATLCSPLDHAALIASDDGQPVYEAMGYLRLFRMTLWHRPPTG